MAATQLEIYNRALGAMGERRIASLSEQREPRRVLDDFYSDCVQFCMEKGMWNFLMINGGTGPTGSAGYMNYANQFTKPNDLIHLLMASASASYDPPLVGDFIDAGAYWYSDASTLYVRYTSNGNGGNMANWTQTFTTYVVHVLASWSAFRITGNMGIVTKMEGLAARYLLDALAVDHVPQLPGLRPFNSEARAKTVEGFMGQPIDMAPFHASFAQAPTSAQGSRGE